MRLRTWVLRVRVPHVLEIDFDNANDEGLAPYDLVSEDYGATRAFATRLRSQVHRPQAIIVPSAALPGTKNLVLFGEWLRLAYDARPVSDRDIPLAMTADDGIALPSLVPLVRYHGEPHSEYEAWNSGNPFSFVEPRTPKRVASV